MCASFMRTIIYLVSFVLSFFLSFACLRISIGEKDFPGGEAKSETRNVSAYEDAP